MTLTELRLTSNLETEISALGIDQFNTDNQLNLDLVNISNNAAYLDTSIDFAVEHNSFSSSRSLKVGNVNSDDELDAVIDQFFDDFVTDNFNSDGSFDDLSDISFDELDTDQTIDNSLSYTIKDSNDRSEITVTMIVDVADTAVNLVGSNDNDVLSGNSGDDTLSGLDGDDVIYGGAGDDSITSGNGNDLIQGGDDNDALFGNNNNDLILGDNGNDSLSGNGGNDLLVGGNGENLLNGGAGEDTLLGDRHSDTLNGGSDDDVLIGAGGNNTLNGGSGSDIFVIDTSIGSNTIEDFELGIDSIGLIVGLTPSMFTFSGSNIVFENRVLATLTGVETSELSDADFVNLI